MLNIFLPVDRHLLSVISLPCTLSVGGDEMQAKADQDLASVQFLL